MLDQTSFDQLILSVKIWYAVKAPLEGVSVEEALVAGVATCMLSSWVACGRSKFLVGRVGEFGIWVWDRFVRADFIWARGECGLGVW